MANAPTGIVTLLFTDIEGSTQMLHRLGDRYPGVLAEHRRLLRAAFTAHGGYEVDTQGDAFLIAFGDAAEAVAAGVEAQQALATHTWPDGNAVRVRMGMHTGTPMRTEEGYAGVDLHRGARVAAAGHGGQILITQATADRVRSALPPDVSLRDLGYHRLKDFPEPAILFQIVTPHLQNDFPPLRSVRTGSNNLPAQTTSFIGREQELDEVNRLLDSTRLLTVLGPGGIGKTRLALEAVAARVERYTDGVWFVELALLADPALVAGSIAQAVGVREEPGKLIATVLVEALQSRNLLLVLDNCEHLVDSCATLVQSLLARCPDVQILASSQETLRTAGEAIYRLSSLTFPGDGRLPPLEELRAFEAVRLFAERANSVSPGFAVTEQNARGVVDICRHLDGIPLALELAAARVRVLSPAQIAEHLIDRFRLLTGGSRTAPARQQTLLAAIDWSYQLLNESEQTLFTRLSVFAGSLDYDAAVAVCLDDGSDGMDGYTVLDLLTGLVDKSLILADDEAGGRQRYRLLESIRQYAEQELSARGDVEDTRRRHREYYLALAEQAAPALLGPEQTAWLSRLAREHDNCRSALGWSSERHEPVPALRLATALGRFWERRGYLSEGRAWLEQLLAQTDSVPSDLRARGLEYEGRLARLQGDYAGARRILEQSLDLYRELGERQRIAGILSYLGVVALRQGDLDRAQPLQEEALSLQRELGDQRAVAATLLNLSNIARRRGDGTHAITLRRESLDLYRAVGDKQGMALALSSLGTSATDAGEFARAVSLKEESLTLGRELGDWYAITRPLYSLVTPLLEQGDIVRAAYAGREALAICETYADRDGMAYSLEALAAIAAAQDEMERAAWLLGAAAALRERIGSPLAGVDRATVERVSAVAQAGLGPEGYARADRAGRSTDPAEVVRSALAMGEEPTKEPRLAPA